MKEEGGREFNREKELYNREHFQMFSLVEGDGDKIGFAEAWWKVGG